MLFIPILPSDIILLIRSSLNKYLLDSYHVTDAVQGTGDNSLAFSPGR